MKIQFSNLGAIKQAEITLGDLTIICGANNTGKTYVTYATYGFLDYWQESIAFEVDDELVNQVMEDGDVQIPISTYIEQSKTVVESTAKKFSELVANVFAGKAAHFTNTSVVVEQSPSQDFIEKEVSFTFGSSTKSLLDITSEKGKDELNISLLVNRKTEDLPPRSMIKRMITLALKDLLFIGKMPRPFIASAERTGSAIFQKELDFTRSRLVDVIADKTTDIKIGTLLDSFKGDYPIPVRENVDFIRRLSSIVNKESVFAKEFPHVLSHFRDIIGGDYHISDEGAVLFQPDNSKVRLTMVESSSAVRSMLDVGFYLKHEAQKGDILIIDEPELNFHPENQRKVARLLAIVANCGIKVFVTTHSDYIIRELNTLLLLNSEEPRLKALAEREGYEPEALINCEQVKVYIAKQDAVLPKGKKRKVKANTLVEARITKDSGIELETFDSTIDKMNQIQDEIVWGD